jgi:predicted nucleic acid-binding protein
MREKFTAAVGLRAGQIDGENQARGVRLPLSDLLIGVTALELGYGVATLNVRHFRLVPGLSIVQF